MTPFLRSLRCLLFLALLPLGCAQDGPGRPPVDVPRLAEVVADVLLAESVVAEVPNIVRDSLRLVYYERTLGDHGMRQAEFDSLLNIVRREPAWVDSVFTRAGEILAQREATGRGDGD